LGHMATISKTAINKNGGFADGDLSLGVTAETYHDIQHFLFREALLLDHRRFDEWASLLANDVVFRMPVRFAQAIGIETPPGVEYFNDDRRAITSRIKMLEEKMTSPAGQRVAAAQTRRFITNVIVCPHHRDEYNVLSYMMLTRSNAPGEVPSTVFTAERHDRLRGSPRRMHIVHREIVLDQRNANVDIDVYL
jgi:PAH dioxygenase small subunit